MDIAGQKKCARYLDLLAFFKPFGPCILGENKVLRRRWCYNDVTEDNAYTAEDNADTAEDNADTAEFLRRKYKICDDMLFSTKYGR